MTLEPRPTVRPRIMRVRLHVVSVVAVLVAAAVIVWDLRTAAQAISFDDFERDLAALREPFDIPGMPSAIAERGEIVVSASPTASATCGYGKRGTPCDD